MESFRQTSDSPKESIHSLENTDTVTNKNNTEENNDNDENFDENADFDNYDDNTNYEEDNDENNFDENEVVIDSDSDADLGIDDSSNSVDLSFSILRSIVNTYSAFMYESPAQLNSYGTVSVNLPTYFLPLSLQSVYGFDVDPNILNIEIRLDNQDWSQTPVNINIQHPVYKNNYVGRPLISAVVEKFFSKDYKPLATYRSESYLLYPTGKADENFKQILISEGFDSKSAERALIICSNNLFQSREFLCTGVMPEHDSILSIEYSACPLLYLILEFADCFLDLQDHCCICRSKMEPGLKPSVCAKTFCNFRLNQIGLGVSVVQEIQRDPLAADLVVSIFSASIDTEFFNPSPPGELASQARSIIQKLPSMEILKGFSNDEQLLQVIKNEAFELLRWILLSNRSQLITLPDEYKLQQFPSTHQFMTLISTPESERAFKNLKDEYGSLFLWHGSNGEKWHSIIRNGLKNYSGTKFQSNGAALGPGIYLAKSSDTSWGYSRCSKNNYTKSALGKELHIIGLCEVAKMLSSRGKRSDTPLKDHGWAHTLTCEEACVVRFLFVDKKPYGDSYRSPFSVDVVQEPPKKVPTLRDVLSYMSHKNNV